VSGESCATLIPVGACLVATSPIQPVSRVPGWPGSGYWTMRVSSHILGRASDCPGRWRASQPGSAVMRLWSSCPSRHGQPFSPRRCIRYAGTEPERVRMLAVRVSPDCHAQLPVVGQVYEISLTDLMMRALENHMPRVVRRRTSRPRLKGPRRAEAHMARTRAMLLGTPSEAASPNEPRAG
jgi:hypothetical protein